ncbi:MAG: tetratricopeptide repeat protein [Nitrospirae bacterium]|nr:MAG: tetratricopeptide repeat protein [Nitrospirota bacterium]
MRRSLFFSLLFVLLLSSCISPSGYWLEGKGAYDRGQYQLAINYWTMPEVVSYAPNISGYSNHYRWLGHAYYKNKNYRKAVEAYKKALEHRPQRAELETECWDGIKDSYHALFEELRGSNQLKAAIPLMKEAIAVDPKQFLFHADLGYVYNELKQHDEAIESLRKALELKDDATTYNNLGWAYYNKQKYDEALRHFNKAIQLDPKMNYSFPGRAWSNYFLGNFEESLRDFNKILESAKPDDKTNLQWYYRGKAWSYLGLGDAETAFGFIKKAKEILEYDTSYEHSMMYYAMGDKAKAWQYRGGRGMVGVNSKSYSKGVITGVEVEGVTKGGPAENAGVMQGDILLSVNNEAIKDDADFFNKVRVLSPGMTASMRILREGVERDVKIRIGSAEIRMEQEELVAPVLAKKKGGRTYTSLVPQQKTSFKPVVEDKAAPLRPDTYAVIIGIDYNGRHDIPNLQFAANDAKKVYDIFTDPYYGGIPQENVTLLLNEKATRNEMVAALRKVKNWDGYVYVYYSGHGAPKTKDDKFSDGFLVPYDAVITDPEAMEDTSIKISYLKELVDSSQAKGVMVALDACFTGGGKSIIPKGGKPLVGMMASSELIKVQGLQKVIITSSAVNQQSWEDETELKSGIFSHYFIESLTGRANKDVWVRVDDIANYIKENVPKAVRKLKGVEQVPQIAGTGNFPVTRNWERAKIMDVDIAKSKLKAAFEKGLITADQLSKSVDELKASVKSKILEAFLEGKIDERKFGELY